MKRLLTAMAALGVTGMVVLTIAVPFSFQFWLADLLNFFRAQWTYLGVIVLALCIVAGGRVLTGLAAMLVVVNIALTIVPALHAGRIGTASAVPAGVDLSFRIVTLNLFWDNLSRDVTERFLREQAAEMVALQEVNRAARSMLERLRDVYPYQARDLVEGKPSSSEILSRLPLQATSSGPSAISRAGAADLRAGRIRVISFHPSSPHDQTRWRSRNDDLDELMIAARTADVPALIISGDWNTPVWSPFLARFLSGSGLVAVPEIWPAPTRIFDPAPWWRWLGSPIDRTLTSLSSRVRERTLGPPVGSDHLPVVSRVGLEP